MSELAERTLGRAVALDSITLIWLMAMLGTLEEVCLRQPHAYLGPGGGPPPWAAGTLALGGAVMGGALAYRARHDVRRWLPIALGGAACSTGLSGACLVWAFDHCAIWSLVALSVPALTAVALAACAALGGYALFPLLIASSAVTRWARPLVLLGVGLLFGLGAALFTHAGMVRASATLGLVWLALAWWWSMEPPRLRGWAWITGSGLLLGLLGLGQTHRLMAPADLEHHPAEVVKVRSGPLGHYLVTSAQEHFNLFVDGRLEVSTLDEHRYYEALVHPAMQSARNRRRVLLLGGGKGPAEREILRYPEVERMVVVLHDRSLYDLSRGMRWLSERSQGALSDARLCLVEAEPIVWLDQAGELFDVAIVDLADPNGYFEGKNFTVFFYRQLMRRLGPEGVIAVQATSPLRSPRSFSLIESTLKEAGWATLPYHAPVVTLGEWGFVLGARRPLEPPRTSPPGARYLTSETLREIFHWTNDFTRPAPGSPNVLYHQRLVEIFEQEKP